MAVTDHFGQMTASWLAENELPWAKMRYEIYRRNLSFHVGKEPIQILDAGGGTGEDAFYYAKQGYSVTLVDCSAKMLETARQSAEKLGVIDQIRFIQVKPESMLEMLDENSFGLILCHMMIEFVPDAEMLLGRLCDLLVPGGCISIVDTNRFGDVYMEAFQKKNLVTAMSAINQKMRIHPWVNQIIPRYAAEDLIPVLEKNGCSVSQRYGILNICAYLPNEPKFDPVYYHELLELEYRLTDQFPYYLLARFFQIIATKKSG